MITRDQMEKSHRLWDELADFAAARTDDALRHLMRTMTGWLDARDLVWVGAARMMRGARASQDPQQGWRGMAVQHFYLAPEILAHSQQAAREQDNAPALTTIAVAAAMGRPRVHRLRDGFVDFAAFRKTAHYRVGYEQQGLTDRMWVAVPVNADAESFLLVDRYHAKRFFTARDAEWVAYTMRGLKWFHRELMLSHGLLVAGRPLTVTERRVLHLLLTDHTEAEIAAQIGHSPHTTHSYVKEILRKYGVRGRTGLMALWLRAG
jgi:DNA-binding CsgD family transcriptional regulator